MSVRDTSIETFHAIKEEGLLSERRLHVYSGLFEHGPCSANELHQRMGRSMGTKNVQANLHARLNELVKMGVAREVQTKVCGVTGRNVIEFDVTSHKPVEHVCPHETKTQKIKRLEREAINLQIENKRLRGVITAMREKDMRARQLTLDSHP